MNKEMSVSQFKIHCLKVLSDISENKLKEMVITKKNKPIAIVKCFDEEAIKPIAGSLKQYAKVVDDIDSSIDEKWDVMDNENENENENEEEKWKK
jgi:hypothetical protein